MIRLPGSSLRRILTNLRSVVLIALRCAIVRQIPTLMTSNLVRYWTLDWQFYPPSPGPFPHKEGRGVYDNGTENCA